MRYNVTYTDRSQLRTAVDVRPSREEAVEALPNYAAGCAAAFGGELDVLNDGLTITVICESGDVITWSAEPAEGWTV